MQLNHFPRRYSSPDDPRSGHLLQLDELDIVRVLAKEFHMRSCMWPVDDDPQGQTSKQPAYRRDEKNADGEDAAPHKFTQRPA